MPIVAPESIISDLNPLGPLSVSVSGERDELKREIFMLKSVNL